MQKKDNLCIITVNQKFSDFENSVKHRALVGENRSSSVLQPFQLILPAVAVE